ncbi:diguanylate cyclase domain-containing protein [Peribacillus sp. SCS-37]|uniref:diguanylate cyclase domain-containing protein n=1 Tax=Paraperibacillus esterisolvens TaxID=3115296 RepID=UPI003906461A
MNIRLRTFVAFIITIVILGLAGVLAFTIGRHSGEKVKAEIGNTLSAAAYQMGDKLDFFMWSRAGEIEIISELADIRDFEDPARIKKQLDQLKASFPAFSWVGLTDSDGKVTASTGDILTGVDISKRPVYQEGIKGKFIGDVHDAVLLAQKLPNPTGEPLQFVDIAKPVVGSGGELRGVLAAHLSWQWSREVQEDIVKPYKEEMKEAEIFVVSKTNNTIILGPKVMVGKPLNIDAVTTAQKGLNNWSVEEWPDGKRYLTGYAYGDGYKDYAGLGWSVLVRIPEEKAFLPVKELQASLLKMGLAASLLFGLISFFLTSFITRPLLRISDAANQLQAGKKVDIPLFRGIREMSILSSSLDRLVKTMTQAETELGRMETLAHHDALTGLRNRIALDTYLEKARHLAIEGRREILFLYLDLDEFKQVNDVFGHHTGDLLLKLAAERLIDCISGEDAVFRLGGDEFLVVLSCSEEEPIKEGALTAEAIISRLCQPFYLQDKKPVFVGCSIGAALWPKTDEDPIKHIRSADEALYISKRTGKNKLSFHNENQRRSG